MELGQKIKALRLEQGLSQRQLCDGKLTRNMLSQIENGSARPSMDTLRYFAQRLGKPVSYFLEEQAVVSPNMTCMEAARNALAAGDGRKALELLEDYREPDPLFREERQLLRFQACLREAEKAIREDRLPYGREMLNRAEECGGLYITQPLLRQLRLLRAEAGEPMDSKTLCWEEALLARVRLTADPARRLEILTASENKDDPQWQLLAGEARLSLGHWRQAADHFRLAEAAYPEKVWPLLEQCCRELEDYKGAYEYACKARNGR